MDMTVNLKRVVMILWFGFRVAGLPPAGNAQEMLALDREVSDSLPMFGRVLQYSISMQGGVFLEVILDVAERDFPIQLGLYGSEGMLAFNEGLNYPEFLGAYLFVQIPATGTYRLEIAIGSQLDRRVDFTLVAHGHASDEPDGRSLRTYDVLDGVIGPADDYDTFLVSLRKGNPVLFVVATPYGILDSIVGLFDAAGNLAAYNNDFFGTGTTLLFVPETTGTYELLIQGYYLNSMGPYRIMMNPVPLQTPPFTVNSEIGQPGEMQAYQIPLKANQVYDFAAYAVDEFYPILALADAWQNVIASAQADPGFPAALIEGFTPLKDEILYLYVMGDNIRAVGYCGVETALREDEEDGIELRHGSVFQGVIGPIGDVDEYRFSAAEGMDYSILVTPTQHYLDPMVRVLDASGNVLFYNDNSADGIFSMLSGIVLPASAEYRIQVSASPDTIPQRQTGVYLIQLATGTTFDWGAPHIAEDRVEVTPGAAGAHIHIPISAIADDTFPLSATLTVDRTGESMRFAIEQGKPVELDIAAQPDGIFFLTLSDASYKRNTVGPVTIPGPRILAGLEGMPMGLAVDRNNNLYVADSWIGGIVKYDIGGASETILRGEHTQGGMLGPNAVAFDADGNLFLANGATHSVVKVLPGGATETVAANLNFPVALTFGRDGVMYVAQIGSDTVDKVYKDGTVETFVTGIRNPTGLAFSPEGMLFVCNSSRGESTVYLVEPDGSAEPFVEPFADSLHGLAFDRDGNLYVTDENTGFLYRIGRDGRRIVLTQDIGASAGLAFGYGDYAKTLFVCSGHNYNNPYRTPLYYEQRLLAVPTGRVGIPVPDMLTPVEDWLLY